MCKSPTFQLREYASLGMDQGIPTGSARHRDAFTVHHATLCHCPTLQPHTHKPRVAGIKHHRLQLTAIPLDLLFPLPRVTCTFQPAFIFGILFCHSLKVTSPYLKKFSLTPSMMLYGHHLLIANSTKLKSAMLSFIHTIPESVTVSHSQWVFDKCFCIKKYGWGIHVNPWLIHVNV